MTIQNKYNDVLGKIKEIFIGSHIWRYNLSELVYELKNAFPKFDWVGIYLLQDQMLILETFIGKPTDHSKIPIDKGICGLAAMKKTTQLLEDVTRDDRYIACDIHVKSEIVVPIVQDNKVIGVLDIDSNTRAAFQESDKDFLEQVAKLVAKSHPKITTSPP